MTLRALLGEAAFERITQAEANFDRKLKFVVPNYEQVGDCAFQAFAKMELNLTLAEAMEKTPRELDAFINLYLHKRGEVVLVQYQPDCRPRKEGNRICLEGDS